MLDDVLNHPPGNTRVMNQRRLKRTWRRMGQLMPVAGFSSFVADSG